MSKGKLYVISGPSGAGKGTICKKVIEADVNIRLSVSMTTRDPREGEIEAVDYFFVSRDDFEKLLSEGGLLEYNLYVNNYYGTPREQVIKWLHEGHDVILEIDYHGAFQVKEAYPEAVLIFILPPSVDELKARIIGRGSESEETLKKRLEEAMNDLEQADKYDYCVINENVDAAADEVQRIMNIERSKEA
ncbi:MAG: guanylate kinase [Eubacteriales bacterium]|nr:guanylate kinase [Eubacteriales bacterium]